MKDHLDPSDRERLIALADGQLAGAERAELEARLASDPTLADGLRAYRAQRGALHAHFDPVLDEEIPARMLPRSPVRRPVLARVAAAAALVLFGAAGGSVATWRLSRHRLTPLSMQASPANEVSRFVRQASIAYAAYAPEARRPVEIGVDQQQHLVAWLSKRLGREIPAPFLEDRGLALLGGRLLPGEANEPAAQFMYETRAGERVTLYVRALVSEPVQPTTFRVTEEAGVSTFYWVDRDWGYALSGTLPRATLLDVARAVYEQLGR
jgi:anti-sigma factor RsiW